MDRTSFLPAGMALLLGCATSTPPGKPVPFGPLSAGEVAVLDLEEHDLDGDSVKLPGTTATVDINSRIAIAVNHDGLAVRASRGSQNPLTSALVSDYVGLQRGATKLAEGLEPLRKALDAFRTQRQDGTRGDAELKKVLSNVASPALQLVDYSSPKSNDDPTAAARRAAFHAALNQALESATSVTDQYVAVQAAAMTEVERLRRDLRTALAKEGVQFLMGAWLGTATGTSAVHLPGFDSYSDQPRYEVDRFRLTFTEEQQKQYASAKAAASQINAGKSGDVVKDTASSLIDSTFTTTLGRLRELESSCRELAQAAEAAAADIASGTKTLLADLGKQRTWFEDTVAKLRETLTSQPDEIVARIGQAIEESVARGKAIDDELAKFRQKLDSVVGTLQPAATKVRTALDDTSKALNTDVGSLYKAAKTSLIGVQINAAVLAYGEEVKRFDIESLPASTELDLELTGRRAEGDQVVIKLGVQRGSDRVDDIDVRHLLLRRVLLHVETSVGLVFARPINGTVAGSSAGFQAAPSYGAFFKRGSRTSPFWNNVLNPGLGMNVAALDFNLDGVPEIGLAGALSIFRDWVQGGVGYNLFQKRWYAFVGIGLPLPTFGMTTTSSTSGASSGTSGH
jgi:hypothetical protein